MCGRYVSPEQASIERAWKIDRTSSNSFPRRFNVQPTTAVPVLLLEDGARTLCSARWGLIPHWWKQDKPPSITINARLEEISGKPMWRDMMARLEGPIVSNIQGIVAENWLECCGEILTGEAYFPSLDPAGDTSAFVIKSSPSDRATSSRVAFQLLMEAADRHIRIATPYFLPDRALRRALVERARRGVAVTVIVPGRRTDQKWVRLASRRMWGALIEAGVRVFEYRDSMMHAKVLIVDEEWSVLGTTNIDNRSFEHNDEVNLAMRDPLVAARLLEDYERDLGRSDEVTLERWRSRPLWEKIVGPFIWILERQQ